MYLTKVNMLNHIYSEWYITSHPAVTIPHLEGNIKHRYFFKYQKNTDKFQDTKL